MTTKSYGTISPEQRRAISGLEFVNGLAKSALPLNTMAQTLGYDVVEAESGRIVVASPRQVLNSTHGALCTADSRLLFSIAVWA